MQPVQQGPKQKGGYKRGNWVSFKELQVSWAMKIPSFVDRDIGQRKFG